MCSGLCGRRRGCVSALLTVLFQLPSVTHVIGTALRALHESAVWGYIVSEMAKIMGLNTLTSALPPGGPCFLNGKNHDPLLIQT